VHDVTGLWQKSWEGGAAVALDGRESELAKEMLIAAVEGLRSASYADLWARFTARERGWITRKVRVVAADPELDEAQDAAGDLHQIEMWAAIEYEANLHIFVTVYPHRRADLAMTDDLIVEPPPRMRHVESLRERDRRR
jgi:hypothetical protein